MTDKEKIEHDPSEIPDSANFELIGLEAENIKRLKVVKLGLKGKSLVIVGGMNTQGKTSLLDCIPIALGGKKEQPEEVIRRGESHGKIILDMDEIGTSKEREPIGLKITVVFTKKGGRKLILEGKDGFPFRSPQEIFDRFTSRLTFDPMEFIRMDKDKQVKVIRDFAGINFTELDQKYQSFYSERTLLNRDLKSAQGNYETLKKEVPLLTPDDLVDLSVLLAEKDRIVAENRKNDERKKKVEGINKSLKDRSRKIYEIKEEISRFQGNLAQLEMEQCDEQILYEDYSERLSSLIWADTLSIDNQIQNSSSINIAVSKKKLMLQSKSKVDEIEKSVLVIESKMEQIRTSRARQLSSAKYPVPGFKIDDEGNLLYNDLPFSQASGMEQIDVAIDMAMAINPHLKLALVREGSIIDLDNLKRIGQRVEAAGGKLIMERTGKGPEMSVIISEGEIIEER